MQKFDPAKLTEVVNALNHEEAGHWTKDGLIDLNHVKEAMGCAVSRKDMEAAGFSIVTRESTKAGKETPAPEGEAAEMVKGGVPTDPAAVAVARPVEQNNVFGTDEDFSKMLSEHPPSALQAGDFIMKTLDRLCLMMTPEVRTRQGELSEVLQLYQAERPTIMEKQKRLIARAEMKAKAKE